MTDDDTHGVPPASPADERPRARLAVLDATNEHGRRLMEHYGRADPRPRFTLVGRANAKSRRLRR